MAITWWQADPGRLELESKLLGAPWQLKRAGERWLWSGGTLQASCTGVQTPKRAARLIYPLGYPARFVEIRLIPDPPHELWARLGTHLNVDGSVCFIAGESWTPQMTVRSALTLATDWWFNYWVIVECNQWFLNWPDHGRVIVPADQRAALHYR